MTGTSMRGIDITTRGAYRSDMEPKRIQRKRTKGWRMPEGAVYVGRPSRYGNPWVVAAQRRTWLAEAAHRHPYAVHNPVERTYLGTFVSEERARYWATQAFRRDFDGDLEPLRGHDLVCWCPEACGVDVDLGWGEFGGPYDPCALPRGHGGHHDPSPQPLWCHADVLLELANR